MSHSKYVMHKRYGAILFPPIISHDEMIKKENCKSAGFFSVGPDSNDPNGISVNCFGESVSLGLKSTPEDAIEVKCTILNMRPWMLL